MVSCLPAEAAGPGSPMPLPGGGATAGWQGAMKPQEVSNGNSSVSKEETCLRNEPEPPPSSSPSQPWLLPRSWPSLREVRQVIAAVELAHDDQVSGPWALRKERSVMAKKTYQQVKSVVSAHNKSQRASDPLVIALIWKESGFDEAAKNPNSSAVGFMQLTKAAVEDATDNNPDLPT